jgi:hypothetical protein
MNPSHLFLAKALPFRNFVVSLQRTTNSKESMTIVSTRDFRANQTKFLDMALRGEHVVLKSRRGSFRLTPVKEEEAKRDVTTEICRGMKHWKEYLETGKSDYFRPAEELINELRNSNG